MVLLQLFWAWFQIGMFSIGGGYAALPVIKSIIVDHYGWLSVAKFADLIVIDQMAPGPLIINSATFVGAQAAGFGGAVVSTLGCLAGPTVIISIIAYFYFKYKELPIIKRILDTLRPVAVALISSAGLSVIILSFWGDSGFSLNLRNIDFLAVALAFVAFLTLRKYKFNPVYVILGCGILGGVVYSL